MSTIHFALLVIFSYLLSAVSALTLENPLIPVHLRIEGENATVFEGVVFTRGHVITTPSGGTHQCNGLNNNSNPHPGATCTSALSDAAKKHKFTFDGTFFPSFDDYLITEIAGEEQTATTFWLILKNFQLIPVGGCQEEVTSRDEVLFAFSDFSDIFLKLSGPHKAVSGRPVVFTVTDGTTGAPVAGASVNNQITGADGKVLISFPAKGMQSIKASKSGAVRSNAIKLVVG